MSNKENIKTRPPIITIAGHIDHGKTTLLNQLRKIKMPLDEHGGITQKVNAYNIKTKYGYMTFIDTPGHSAFNSIRIKSIQCSDIMLLILAINDGIQSQTIESIETAQKNNVPIIVCINKIDKNEDEGKKEKIINELSKFNLIKETWGGDTFFSYISGKTGEGISNLIEIIHFQAEMLELKANFSGLANGIILDNTIDHKRGNITSIIIKNGILKKGDFIKTQTDYGKIKLIIENNKSIQESCASMCVNIIGLQNNQEMGSSFTCINEKNIKKTVAKKQEKQEEKKSNIEEMLKKMVKNEEKKFTFIIKADVQGSLDVLKETIKNLSTEKIKLSIIKIELGDISQSDIDLAITTKSSLICFNTKISYQMNKLAKNKNIKIHTFNIIYDIINYIKELIEQNIDQNQKENLLGIAEVKKIFMQSNKTVIAGCVISQGKIKQNSIIKIFRKNKLIHKGLIESIKIFKNQVNEVPLGHECGISIKDYQNIQPSDKIKFYTQD